MNEQKEKNLAKKRFNILNRIFVRGADRPKVAMLGKFSLPNVKAEKDNIFGNTLLRTKRRRIFGLAMQQQKLRRREAVAAALPFMPFMPCATRLRRAPASS